jgi:glycerate dehydrogenase
MKLVVLDGYTLNPGDLSWDALKQLATVDIHDRTPADKIPTTGADAELVLTNKAPITAATIAGWPKLKYIGVLATGYNIVDVAAAKARGVVVANVPAYSTMSVAQATFALLMELTHHVGLHAQTVRDGKWTRANDFCYWDRPLVELAGRTMGIVGLGAVGRAVANIAKAFGMHVIGYSRSGPGDSGVEGVSLEDVFRRSDVISLHCPLTPQTQGLINAERLGWMKPDALLINTGRGALVDEAALASALHAEKIGGAGLDVLSTEPPKADNPLLSAPRCYITPHIAWATRAARTRLMNTAVENVKAFLAGKPVNVVS